MICHTRHGADYKFDYNFILNSALEQFMIAGLENFLIIGNYVHARFVKKCLCIQDTGMHTIQHHTLFWIIITRTTFELRIMKVLMNVQINRQVEEL